MKGRAGSGGPIWSLCSTKKLADSQFEPSKKLADSQFEQSAGKASGDRRPGIGVPGDEASGSRCNQQSLSQLAAKLCALGGMGCPNLLQKPFEFLVHLDQRSVQCV